MPVISVIISTYNKPEWLQKVLWSYRVQTVQDFELVIADDGSGEETKKLIDEFRSSVDVPVKHIWHEDKGFRKTLILNKAIRACESDYIFMTDGDCVARNDMLEVHLKRRKPGYFLSGGNFKLPLRTSEAIDRESIERQQCFSRKWLKENGVGSGGKLFKITASGWLERVLNTCSPTKATWDGNNASAWKSDVLAVNGFDLRMQYGGEDREFGERLMNKGIRPVQLRYSTKGLHLFHDRPYVKPEMFVKNKAIRKATRQNNTVITPFGIREMEEFDS